MTVSKRPSPTNGLISAIAIYAGWPFLRMLNLVLYAPATLLVVAAHDPSGSGMLADAAAVSITAMTVWPMPNAGRLGGRLGGGTNRRTIAAAALARWERPSMLRRTSASPPDRDYRVEAAAPAVGRWRGLLALLAPFAFHGHSARRLPRKHSRCRLRLAKNGDEPASRPSHGRGRSFRIRGPRALIPMACHSPAGIHLAYEGIAGQSLRHQSAQPVIAREGFDRQSRRADFTDTNDEALDLTKW